MRVNAALRVPLMIRTPWLPNSVGGRTPALVEAVALFPTFMDLAGLPPLPSDQVLEGVSLRPILTEPPTTGTGIRPYAFSQFAKSMMMSAELNRMVPWNTCTKCNKSKIDYMVRAALSICAAVPRLANQKSEVRVTLFATTAGA